MNASSTHGIDLVPATMEDFDFLFALKSQPDSIYWGGFSAAPQYESLKKHYEGIFAAGERKTLIIRSNGRRAGVISCRFVDGKVCTDYSINVSSEFAGQGVGRAGLARHLELMREHEPACQEVVALIREDNPRSQRIFANCGYAPNGQSEERLLASDDAPIRLQTWTRALS